MFPFLPWSCKTNMRSSPSAPTASIENSFGSSFSMPSPPTSIATMATTTTTATASSTLVDLSPRKSSYTSYGQSSSSCAFPSWPNRPSLVCSDPDQSTSSSAMNNTTPSTPSAYISDEELLDTPLSSPSEELGDDKQSLDPTLMSMSYTTEQRIRHMREMAEEEEGRAQFLAQVQAHARAQQAMRLQKPQSQLPVTTTTTTNQMATGPAMATIAARRKRRTVVPVVGKKRRATSSSSNKCYPRV